MSKNSKFTKEQLEKSLKYANKIDLIKSCLQKEKQYSISQVEKLMRQYTERRI